MNALTEVFSQHEQTLSQRCDNRPQAAGTVWFTGLSGAGKSTLANALAARLAHFGTPACIVDGDQLRGGLNRDLGFSAADRSENVRRAAEIARLLNEQGIIAIVALISPLAEQRDNARRIVGDARFVEVYVKADVETCARRDVKGLYARALRGEIPDFTGVSSPYDPPAAPTLVLDTQAVEVADAVVSLHSLLSSVPPSASSAAASTPPVKPA